MSLIKYSLRILTFLFMFLAWNLAMFLVMIYLANWFKQYYFLSDISTFMKSSTHHHPYINFGVYTWMLLLYNIGISASIAYLYAKDSISIKPLQFAVGNKETKITLGIILSLISIVTIGVLFKKSIFLNLISKYFINIFTLIVAIIPVSLIFNWFLDRSFLVVHLLSTSVYRKFGINFFKVTTNNYLSFWAQNVGRRKNKFRFKGVCRLDNFQAIKKKKENSEFLLESSINDVSWVELAPQDTMPVQVLSSNLLHQLIGLFSETICIIYEGVDEKLYTENVYLNNCDNNIILFPKGPKQTYIELILIFVQATIIYYLGMYFSSVFLYTLSFGLVLFILIDFIIQGIIRENNNTVNVAIKKDTQSEGLFVQIKNDTLKDICLNLKILDDKSSEKILLKKKDIYVGREAISSIMFFSEKYIKSSDLNISGWKIILEDVNCKQYLFEVSQDRLNKQ